MDASFVQGKMLGNARATRVYDSSVDLSEDVAAIVSFNVEVNLKEK